MPSEVIEIQNNKNFAALVTSLLFQIIKRPIF